MKESRKDIETKGKGKMMRVKKRTGMKMKATAWEKGVQAGKDG